MITFDIIPLGKPRMTQRDRWAKRPCINRYYAYKDHLTLLANKEQYKVPDKLSLTFMIPMPKSWSKKKKALMKYKPHQQRPDLDNLVKAFQDVLCKEDSYVYSYKNITKIWGEVGKIIVND